MHRMVIWTAFFVVFVSSGMVQAQTGFSIRAASAQPVEGWEPMRLEHSDRTIWVAPTAAVLASDIQKAQSANQGRWKQGNQRCLHRWRREKDS